MRRMFICGLLTITLAMTGCASPKKANWTKDVAQIAVK
jgi:hypothetical protein